MGCGETTDDVAGGPCTSCWRALPVDPCPICGDDISGSDREGHLWDEHGDDHVESFRTIATKPTHTPTEDQDA
jgi:hypothetical protein